MAESHQDTSFKTIVVGYDGTRPAERALARAAGLARMFGSKVVVADIDAPEPMQAMPGAFGLTPYYRETLGQDMRRDETVWREHRSRVEAFFADSGVVHEFAGIVGDPVNDRRRCGAAQRRPHRRRHARARFPGTPARRQRQPGGCTTRAL